MTFRIGFHSGIRPAARLGVALLALHGLSACAAATNQGAAPAVAAAGAPTGLSAAGGEVQGNGRNTGTFPNLNVPPAVATEQMTPEEKQARLAELSAQRSQQAAAGASARPTVNPADVKKVAETHADEALKAIEGE